MGSYVQSTPSNTQSIVSSYQSRQHNSDTLLAPHSTPGAATANLTVNLPEAAKLYVNDNLTTSTGAKRNFVSRGLTDGNYRYVVRVEMEQDGEVVTSTKTVNLSAGVNETLTFDMQNEMDLITSIQLNVPENAQVELNGQKTRSSGPVRKYITRKLQQGQEISDYHIVVKFEQDGEMITRSKSINLTAGDSVSLDFETAELIVGK